MDGDQGHDYQLDEEGPDGYFKCDACGNGWGLLRHAFEEHISWFVRPDSACWVCPRQYFLPSNAMRHFKESGHEGSFSGGMLGLWVEGIRKIIERSASRRGWKDWEETLEGLKLLWEKLGVFTGVLGWREEWLGFFFVSYVGEGSLETKEGRFSLKPLKGVGVLSHCRVLLSMMKGEGREKHGDEVRMKGFGVVEWGKERFELFDAHCHIDRVLRGVNVKGAEELGKRWEILGLEQGEGRTNWGYCNKFLLARGMGEY